MRSRAAAELGILEGSNGRSRGVEMLELMSIYCKSQRPVGWRGGASISARTPPEE